ncbi:MAG: homocysteine S-methyltransferase family protein [Lachnospiraceae bacterium]|nr:homocysteine S-methyltransferase family protein [Lachnospiraceae bacterium]
MKREEFDALLNNKILYLDGATGSNLVKKGMPAGCCPEKWILEHPKVLIELQTEYVKAGTDILYAPTFTANRIKLAEYGLEHQLDSIVQQLVDLSKEAAQTAVNRKVYVAGNITMTGRQLQPMGDMELETLIDIYKEEIVALVNAGVDLLVVETMMSLAEARAALIAAKEVCDLPVMVTMTFEKDGRTLYGSDAATCAIVLESLGAAAIGVNCSTGPKNMRSIISSMAEVTNIPLIAKPNAGMPALDKEGNTVYDMEEQLFATEMAFLVEAGATILGGCCGTAPSYIRKIADRFGKEAVLTVPRKQVGMRYLTSERQILSFGLNDPFIVIGERINPTGKKKFQETLRNGDLSMALAFAEEQEACGAKVLDVNVGMSGIDEKATMLQVLQELTGVTNLPLSLDSSSVEVLEAALRNYPGRALINSVSLESEKFHKLLPLVKKYGAMFILLPLSDKGLPENLEEKKQIISTIYERALELGLTREDIVVDGLVTTVGANKAAALETLETIRYCKAQGFATACGLSNISFGMPERSYVNTAFVALAIQAGLTMAILNPSQELLMGCALASDLLLNKQDSDFIYIEKIPKVKELGLQKEIKASAASTELPKSNLAEADCTQTHPLYQSVLKGNRSMIEKRTHEALEAGEAPQHILNEYLLPAIQQVGELFDKGKYFLPQLIASAEAMKLAIEVLEPLLLQEEQQENMPTVIIATVEGDIHDIGKNLVALMLKNYGFRVIDLGKDVPLEQILQAARDYEAQIIALSALMTTTMTRMKEVVEQVHAQDMNLKVLIGGAVITPEYAQEIGADGYATDAADAVKVAQKLTKDF